MVIVLVVIVFVTYLGAVSFNRPAIAVPFSHTLFCCVGVWIYISSTSFGNGNAILKRQRGY
jgi:hypothetical protein